MIIDDEYADFLLREAKHFNKMGVAVQLIKLVEEVGEVAAAWIGVQGSNPRKGITHREYEVADELADVVNTALLAMVKLGFDPAQVMTKQQAKAETYMEGNGPR